MSQLASQSEIIQVASVAIVVLLLQQDSTLSPVGLRLPWPQRGTVEIFSAGVPLSLRLYPVEELGMRPTCRSCH